MQATITLPALLLAAAGLLCAADERTFNTWSEYLGGSDSSQYSSLKQINKSNVKQLEVVWTYPTAASEKYLFNPLVAGGVMYVQAKNNSIVALDAVTGKELWAHPFQGPLTERGINYWESKDRTDRRLFTTNGGYLTAIDARTGQTIQSFGDNGRTDLRAGLDFDYTDVPPIQTNNPGRIFENIMIVPLMRSGSDYAYVPGDIHAYDVRTGKLLWQFHTVPRPGEFGYETWPKDFWQRNGGGINWNELSIDEKRGIAYVPTGTGKWDYYGGDRIGQNLFANSTIALDARTGKRLWHFQTVHHDLWDYDLPAGPKLLTVKHDGKNVDVVIQPTKQGFLFVLDRLTGQPLWPVEERPVPKSDVPGEQSWPTQPFPTKPPPFARQALTEKDLQPLHARGRTSSLARADSKCPQRRTVHSSKFPGERGDSGQRRRRKLGYRGCGSRQGHAVHRVERCAHHADPGSARRSEGGGCARHQHRQGEGKGRPAATPKPHSGGWSVHSLRRPEHRVHVSEHTASLALTALVPDDGLRSEHGHDQVAGALRERHGAGGTGAFRYRRHLAERRTGGHRGRVDFHRDQR